MSTVTTTATNSCSQAPKFSRYRSVRKAAAASIPEDVPASPAPTSAQLNRTPSRYHRNSRPRTHTVPLPVTNESSSAPEDIPLQHSPSRDQSSNEEVGSPIQARQSQTRRSIHTQQRADGVSAGSLAQDRGSPDGDNSGAERQPRRQSSTVNRSLVPRTSYEAAREEARMILEGEYDRLQELKRAQAKPDREQHAQAPNLKRRVTQVRPPQSKPVYVDAPKMSVKVKAPKPVLEQYHDMPQSIRPIQQAPVVRSNPAVPIDKPQQTATKPPAPVLAASISTRPPIPTAPKQLITPQFDAPISAVNAGDRRVEVRFNHAERGITLPVTPTTDPKDLLNSASIVMSETFNPKTSILVESFSEHGLERPLRRYEHIRDIMNSWDSDNQNYLKIMTGSEFEAIGLERSDVPELPPAQVMVQMHLSIRPGKWDKRWVILREDGQVTMSKSENDGEGTNICHLSDYDVYTPTEKQRKKLKPPKKICFAVKSQQKSAMFLEGTNFIHFFATNDKQIADRWYAAVQSWRSWYLAHMRGEGVQKPKEAVGAGGLLRIKDLRPSSAQSTESTPYQLGSFKPLLNFDELDFSASSNSVGTGHESDTKSSPKRSSGNFGAGKISLDRSASKAVRHGSGAKAALPVSAPSRLILEAETKGLLDLNDSDQGFTGGGLLGRAMTTRRSQGAKSSGRGVSTINGKPLVDLAPASDFADGSLLKKLEAWSTMQGETEPKIDRMKRLEAKIRTGEGM